jgi:hypothetical protein
MTRLHLIAVALLAASCSDHGEMHAMWDHAAAMDVHLDGSRLDLHHHELAVEGAGALDDIALEEGMHVADMAEHELAMTHEMAEMMDCHSSDAMDRMMDDMDRMMTERESHTGRMAGMTTLGDARSEEDAYQGRMAELMADLEAHLMPMMDGSDMPCAHHD